MEPTTTTRPRLRALTEPEIVSLVVGAGFDAYRGRQLHHWLQKKGARSLDEMKNLPVPMRAWLAENTDLGGVASVAALKSSRDGSYKFLFQLEDGKKIESVLMPDPVRNYWTLCISSQVGCAVDCKFCVTGFNGFFRHLRADEIVDQVLFARRHLATEQPGANFRNIVYMGMGEPLLNVDNVLQSLRVLTQADGASFSPRRVTVSTSGIVPGMIALAESGTNANLAVSLNAPNAAMREQVMPITKKYPLADLLDVVRNYKFGKNKRVTFEYVMLAGINDAPDHARQLVKLLKGIPCKVNLIPFNPNPVLPYGRPTRASVDEFADILLHANLTTSVRWSKALDVDGACGQLAGEHRQRKGRPAPPAPEAPAVAAGLAAFSGDLDFFASVVSDDDGDDAEE